MTGRDQSRDGFGNRLESYLLTHGRYIWQFVNGTKWLGNFVNTFIINRAVLKTKPRPHQFSTLADYTSWHSLTDRGWSGRHLAARDMKNLPAPETVLELFKVPEGGKRKPSEKSTFLFASFAQWFTDGFLMTDDADRRKNYSSHQIDLSPLYGLNSDVTRQLRLNPEQPGKRGRLASVMQDGEEFAHTLFVPDSHHNKPEFSLVPQPLNMNKHGPVPFEKSNTVFAFGGDRANTTPVTSAINTLFLREHNRVAGVIEKDNPGWDDDRVFETARNVVIALLLKIVVEEYINHISPYLFKFRANPAAAWHARWNKPNWIAVEFNLLYRWHGFVPDEFILDGKPVPVSGFILNNALLGGRGLEWIFDQASKQEAGQLGLFNTAAKLHGVELASINQGRLNRLASYNDYREAMKFPRVTDFNQINGDPNVIDGLRNVYCHVDNIEFFAGLFAEETRPSSAVPSLIGRMVAVDAFSQALTNPLLSEDVFNAQTFTESGMKIIDETKSLRDIVLRNCPQAPPGTMVTFDQEKPEKSLGS